MDIYRQLYSKIYNIYVFIDEYDDSRYVLNILYDICVIIN